MIKTSKIYKMRVVFRALKNGTTNVFKAVREMILHSGLPFEPAKINKQWPRFSYGPSLSVHQQALREYVDVYLSALVPAEEVQRKLEEASAGELVILNVQRVPYAMPSVQNLAAAAIYSVEGPFASFALEQTVENYFNAPRVEAVYRSESGLALSKNIKPYVLQVQTLCADKIRLTLACAEGKWISPQEVVASYLGMEIPAQQEDWTVEGFTFVREGLYWQDSQGALYLI